MKYIGAHINKQKTLLNTMADITNNDGNALQFFASNPRSVQLANIDKYKEEAPAIIEYCKKNNFKLVIHSPYTINLAKEFKNNSRECDIENCYWIKILMNELILADLLGSIGTVVHVGKYTTLTPQQGLLNMKNALKYIIENMIVLNLKSKIILETPAGQGTELLTNLTDFIDFYNSFSKEERNYLKICIDTAHVWSDGYNLAEAFELFLKKNNKDIAVIHLNNSEKNKGSKVDVHAHLFDGKIPLEDFNTIIRLLKKYNTEPVIILECPSINYNKEINYIKNDIL
jgi:deoxyribonuclease-4